MLVLHFSMLQTADSLKGKDATRLPLSTSDVDSSGIGTGAIARVPVRDIAV
jgi:hypothetical protein